MVKVTVTGQQMPVSCEISDEAIAEGSKAVGDKVRELMNYPSTTNVQSVVTNG